MTEFISDISRLPAFAQEQLKQAQTLNPLSDVALTGMSLSQAAFAASPFVQMLNEFIRRGTPAMGLLEEDDLGLLQKSYGDRFKLLLLRMKIPASVPLEPLQVLTYDDTVLAFKTPDGIVRTANPEIIANLLVELNNLRMPRLRQRMAERLRKGAEEFSLPQALEGQDIVFHTDTVYSLANWRRVRFEELVAQGCMGLTRDGRCVELVGYLGSDNTSKPSITGRFRTSTGEEVLVSPRNVLFCTQGPVPKEVAERLAKEVARPTSWKVTGYTQCSFSGMLSVLVSQHIQGELNAVEMSAAYSSQGEFYRDWPSLQNRQEDGTAWPAILGVDTAASILVIERFESLALEYSIGRERY